MLTDPDVASAMLAEGGGADPHMSQVLEAMLHSGFRVETEPFLRGCLHAIRQYLMLNIRKKARHKAACLLAHWIPRVSAFWRRMKCSFKYRSLHLSIFRLQFLPGLMQKTICLPIVK